MNLSERQGFYLRDGEVYRVRNDASGYRRVEDAASRRR